MLDEVLAVTAVDPHLADAGMFGGDPVQEPVPATESCTLAAVTSTARGRPIVGRESTR